MTKDTNKAIHNPWFWTWVGLILVVLTVNGIFIYFAYETNPGLVTHDYYERGQYYEENMLKRQKNTPNWTMNILHPTPVIQDKPSKFILESEGVLFNEAVLYAYRPSDANADFFAPMVRNSDGNYEVTTSFPLKGKWDVLFYATEGDKKKNQPLTLFVKAK